MHLEATGQSRRSPVSDRSYTFRRAHENGAFAQFPLLDPSALRREAKDRGITLPTDPYDELERLDREGAFSPVLFEIDGGLVYRDEHPFVPWDQYAQDDVVTTARRARPRYSPWQLL